MRVNVRWKSVTAGEEIRQRFFWTDMVPLNIVQFLC